MSHLTSLATQNFGLFGVAIYLLGSSTAYADWDAKVRQLCQKDGGVTVYERVQLTHSEYRRLGGTGGPLVVPRKESADANRPYVSENKTTWLNEGNPAVFRSETVIVRTSDGKVLSRLVNYARVKGGFDTGYGCRNVGIELNLEQRTFAIVGVDR